MRLKQKIQEIETFTLELKEFIPKSFSKYQKDTKTKAACERYFEKIVEAISDLTFLIIKDQGLKMPENDRQAFDTLATNRLITQDLANHLRDAKGMRNIIAHQYGTIDDEVVFKAITKELIRDSEEFIRKMGLLTD